MGFREHAQMLNSETVEEEYAGRLVTLNVSASYAMNQRNQATMQHGKCAPLLRQFRNTALVCKVAWFMAGGLRFFKRQSSPHTLAGMPHPNA